MQDRVKAFFDSLAESWDSLAVHPRERVDYILGKAGDLGGARVLDVGCGTGVLLGPLLERVGPEGRVAGLDLSPAMLARAGAKHGSPRLELVEADFLGWDGPGSFDLIVAYSCLPHFPDYLAFFRAAAERLVPGGRLLVAHSEGREAINRCHSGPADPVSLGLPPVGEAASHAAAAGLEALILQDDGDYWILLVRRPGPGPGDAPRA